MSLPANPPSERLASLDAFRGAIMLLMASSGFGIPQIAEKFSDDRLWQFLGYEFEHAPWAGCTLWDLIQPAFMFMVGVALPWSFANRRARGESFALMFGHALWRTVKHPSHTRQIGTERTFSCHCGGRGWSHWQGQMA